MLGLARNQTLCWLVTGNTAQQKKMFQFNA